MLALCLYALVGRIIRRGIVESNRCIVAAQPALLYGYGQWGGVKEVTAAALVATALALAAEIENGIASAAWFLWRSRAPRYSTR